MAAGTQRTESRWRRPGLWLGILAFLGIGFATSLALDRTSPGPLSAVHAQVIDIDGINSCATCHGGWFGDLTSSCRECHEEIAAQIAAGDGIHGRLPEAASNQCGSCHGEHNGAGFAPVNRRSFAMAGIADVADFDHRHIGFAMAGRHLELGCAQCHTHADVQVLPEGAHRYLGLDQDCSTCHEDAHEGRMRLGCADCHGQDDWGQLVAQDHSLHLAGGHGATVCSDCHTIGTEHDLLAAGAAPGSAKPRACTACHDSPHREGLLSTVAAATGTGLDNSCGACHLPEQLHFRDSGLSASMQADWHRGGGFPLDGAHLEVECSACHDPELPEFAARHPGRSPAACATCHEDVHLDQFASSPLAPEGCVDCHHTGSFLPSTIDNARHEGTGYPLVGSHAKAECTACHLQGAGTDVRVFHGTVDQCQQCHENPHGQVFSGFAEVADAPGGTCAHCHGVTAFSAADRSAFQHEHFTGVPIDGAHGFAGCVACHPPLDLAEPSGRTFARASDIHGTGDHSTCATCHRDPHGGHFDRQGLPSEVAGHEGCARCHGTSSFRGVAGPDGDARFDHGLWTGFPLRGSHGEQDCSACHRTDGPPRDDGLSLGLVAGPNCADCHEDPHAGQFAESDQIDCSRCHTDTDPWRTPVFNHEVQSRFPLGEAHTPLPCSACHTPFESDGRQITRYRPLPRDCAACHGDARTPFRRKR